MKLLILTIVGLTIALILFWPKRKSKTTSYSAMPASAYGACYRCKVSWEYAKGHTTAYTETSGCFPLCEPCWEQLTPKERLLYYKQLYNDWQRMGINRKWEDIEKAVLAGG